MSPEDLTPAQLRRIRERQLLAVLNDPQSPPEAQTSAREEMVRLNMGLVEHIVRRFLDRGESRDDLVQVGSIGLLKAIDRFELDRGLEFSTYATPTIVGEIKRHFRDRGWSIRVPRRLQELRIGIGSTSESLAHQLGRTPTVADIAEAMGISQEEVLEGLESARAYSSVSLDAGSGEDGTSTLADTVAATDTDLAQVDNRETLRVAIESLPERERQIVIMRFFGHKTQSQIAAEMGVSQVHVSRLLARSMEQLRGLLSD
jgi:RNA polymerase sigma-B factor